MSTDMVPSSYWDWYFEDEKARKAVEGVSSIGLSEKAIAKEGPPLFLPVAAQQAGNDNRQPLVIVESPYAGNVAANLYYARKCVADCVRRGEAPIASHLLFTQPGILDDDKPEERKLGIEAGLAWYRVADKCVVYADRGMSKGMSEGVHRAASLGVRVETRFIEHGEAGMRRAAA